jgi:hypothetical protein
MMSVFHVEKKKYLHLRMLKEVCASFSFTGDPSSSLFFQHPPYFLSILAWNTFGYTLRKVLDFPQSLPFLDFIAPASSLH